VTGIILIPVEQWGGDAIHFLYQLLGERPPAASISHKAMPSYAEHEDFVRSNPYEAWLLIVHAALRDGHYYAVFHEPVGACYITKMGEIGIQIAAAHQRKGYARTALNTLIEMNKGRQLLANISPSNPASAALFRSFGFRLIQHTYSREVA
jgi:L-amino acid N-acyltransferase YncA